MYNFYHVSYYNNQVSGASLHGQGVRMEADLSADSQNNDCFMHYSVLDQQVVTLSSRFNNESAEYRFEEKLGNKGKFVRV